MNANISPAGGAVDPRPHDAQLADPRQPTHRRSSLVELLDACGNGYTAAERDHILATMREEDAR
jgi:hypothetical protein